MEDFFKYLTPVEEDQKWGIYITAAGVSHFPKNRNYPLKDHPSGYYFSWEKGRVLSEFQILYITEGAGILDTRNERFTIVPGTIIIISPGEWHRYAPLKKEGWVEHYIGFNGVFAKHWLASELLKNDLPVIQCGLKEELLDSFYRVFDYAIKEKPGYQQVASGEVAKLIGLLLAHIRYRNFHGKPIETIIEKALFTIRENLATEIDFNVWAEENNIGYSHFRKMFKKFTGLPPSQYHLLQRIAKARELLVTTQKSVKEIAWETGFETIYYFSRVFKNKTGKVPSALRLNI